MKIRTHRKRGSIDARTTEFLRGVRLFAACSAHEIERLAEMFEDVERPAGAVLIREGDGGRDFYVIVEGTATATLRGEKLASLAPGDFVGEMSLLDHSPRAATVIAETDMTLLTIDARGFASLIEEAPSVARKMLVGMASRLRGVESPASAACAVS